MITTAYFTTLRSKFTKAKQILLNWFQNPAKGAPSLSCTEDIEIDCVPFTFDLYDVEVVVVVVVCC